LNRNTCNIDKGLQEKTLGQAEARREDILHFLQELIRKPSLLGEEEKSQALPEIGYGESP